MSVTLVHPAKAVGRNKIPFGFGRKTHVVPGNIILDRGPSPPTRRGDLGSESQVRSDAPIIKLLWVLLFLVSLSINFLFCIRGVDRAAGYQRTLTYALS